MVYWSLRHPRSWYRPGATGWFELQDPSLVVTIGGVTTRGVQLASVSVREYQGGQPGIASFRVGVTGGGTSARCNVLRLNFSRLGYRGPVITPGTAVKIALRRVDTDQVIFDGRVLRRTRLTQGMGANDENEAFDCECVGHSFFLNRNLIFSQHTNVSATAIVQHIMTHAPAEFSTSGVEANLPVIDEMQFTGETVLDALERVARRIGASWYTEGTVLRFGFQLQAEHAGPVTDDNVSSLLMAAIVMMKDLSPVRTRVWVEGGGSKASADVAAGANMIPVDEGVWYSASGGKVKSGPQKITYTGKSTLDDLGSKVAGKSFTPGAPSAAVAGGTSGRLSSGGSYQYRATFVMPAGESDAGVPSSGVSIAAVSAPSAPTPSVVAGTPGNLGAGGYNYKQSAVTDTGESAVSSGSSGATISPVTAPSSSGLSIVGTTGGNLTPSTAYAWMVTFFDDKGETTVNGSTSFTLGGSDTAVTISNIPTSSDPRVRGRRIYRESPPGGTTNMRLVGEIRDNTTTTFKDTLSPNEAGGQVPGVNTSGSGKMSVTVPVSSDGRTKARRIYRTSAGGSDYKLVGTINDNTTTTFSDDMADSARGVPAPAADASSGNGQINVSSVPTGPAGTTARKVYRTEAGGTVYKHVRTLNDNSTTSFTDNVADSSLGEQAPAASGVGASPGDTTLQVADIAQFPSLGWVRVSSQIIKFTSRNGSVGEGSLNGIPASGAGSIGAAIPAGASVVNHPHLTGVSGISYTIKQGDDVNILVVAESVPAQVAHASALGGGDGVVEEYHSDRRWSIAEAQDQADARLILLKDPQRSAKLRTLDMDSRPGRTVELRISIPYTNDVLVIQSVSYSGFEFPRPFRDVEASDRRYTLEAILRQIRG